MPKLKVLKRSSKKSKNSYLPLLPPMGKSLGGPQSEVRAISKMIQLSNLTSSTSADTLTGYSHQLSDLGEASSFTTIYDQYRFEEVEIVVVPTYNVSTTAYQPQSVLSVIDFDDASVSGYTRASFLQYENCMIHDPFKAWSRRFRPHQAVATYSGSFTSYKNEEAGWNDCASTGVQHYGIKILVMQVEGSATANFNIFARYLITFRNNR